METTNEDYTRQNEQIVEGEIVKQLKSENEVI